MNLKEIARAWVKTVVGAHVGKNIRSYKFATYTGDTDHNALGGVSYLLPAEGRVVEQSEDFTLIKTGLADFCIVKTQLLSEPVAIGDKVNLQFYQLRRFDGTAADGSGDARQNGSRTIMLTGAQTYFPAKWEGRYLGINDRFASEYTAIHNPYLRDMLTQMEEMRVDGGLRRVINVLVDAGAKDLAFVDPQESKSVLVPPGITCTVNTEKFHGPIMLGYDRGLDTYFIELGVAGQEGARRIEDVHFNEMGNRLIDALDDRSWLKAKVNIIKKAPKKKPLQEPI
ncbi:hypothetical protein [Hydrogenophaga sp. BPS33]|uniref:hypothetical protein n=1 Tax=Hydrogenophaga sp. BPS33 TaxID=2651974 RepID=UPI00132019E2|nr:hypothetical protein [Hydrogenophaga sp. BPS33]QHE89301.1 hypothetical protein F9K07_30460 [Hydrogenophaga sp. BPS33]